MMEQRMHHYTECGLDNVWLANGFTVHKTAYGKGVSVDDADELLRAIALSLTDKPGRLTGKEFRYLRQHLGLSQPNAAHLVGVTDQSVSLWERTGKVPVSGDLIMRLLVLDHLTGDGRITQVIDRINAVDRMVHQRIVARTRQHRWSAVHEAAAKEPPLRIHSAGRRSSMGGIPGEIP